MGNASELFQRAATCFQRGELEEASDIAQRVLDRDPGHAEANHLAGLIALGRGEHAVRARASFGAAAPGVAAHPALDGPAVRAGVAHAAVRG